MEKRGNLNRENRANPKERLQYLATGIAAAPQGAEYGAVTHRAAGSVYIYPVALFQLTNI